MAERQFEPDTIDISNVSRDNMAQKEGTAFSDFFSVDAHELDSPADQKFSIHTFQDWTKWNGYYREVPEFSAVVDKLASWAVGRGYDAAEKVEKILKKIKGWGKDDFNSIMENMCRVMLINGDSFAEIIRDKAKRIINLKPMNPGTIKIIVKKNGLLHGYEQTTTKTNFDVKDIFHLCWNREADEIHGVPFAERMETLLKTRSEMIEDLKVLFHRYVKPVQIVTVDTDDSTELVNFKNKWKAAYQKAEPILIPKGTVDKFENMSLPQFSTLDPLPFLKYIIRVFTTASGVPEIVMGWGEETTEASSKVLYLAFQQTIERLQRFLEAQLEMQTGLKIELEFPASIEPLPESQTMPVKSITTDAKKDGKLNQTTKETTANKK